MTSAGKFRVDACIVVTVDTRYEAEILDDMSLLPLAVVDVVDALLC